MPRYNFTLYFRLSGILTHMRRSGYKRNGNRSQGKEIARILPNGNICFAGKKLPVRVPADEDKAENLREALNTFIMLMSHRRGNTNYFQSL